MSPNYILFDTPDRDLLFPFTHTRPAAACKVGLLTIQQKWERLLNATLSHFTVPYLQEKYPLVTGDINILLNGHVLPTAELVEVVKSLQNGEELYKDGSLLAKVVSGLDFLQPSVGGRRNFEGDIKRIDYPWHISQLNDYGIRQDFKILTEGRVSAVIPASNQVVNPEHIFIEEGAAVACSVLNASTGPIYIGKNAQIMEGCLVRGPLAMDEGAVLKMGAKIYGATSIGANSVVGGEVKNTVFFDHSNKGHDGYLGDAVIGEWCNLGASTNCSNLKNNAREVRVWMEGRKEAWSAGLKCGVLMGDYSRCGINTMFNTGTVVGVSANVFGSDFPPKFVPSFTWGTNVDASYRLAEALRDAESWMQLKGKTLSDMEKRMLTYIFEAQRSQK
ncbi:putative sugar nucleotidyl transferase [Chitinophaga horti]|uniref:Sugar nucleotidyl transferase n=1 Tax=Chitinophaga horti TaxID=2920382 RepID=A0ABY6J7L2_9BACT|nr:putative sugar nucleotidyl transferase [Chitinophaga horti]UYQ94277.1 putative sugar nucleotidyl transferase [Chitinophaga horti]